MNAIDFSIMKYDFPVALGASIFRLLFVSQFVVLKVLIDYLGYTEVPCGD